MIVVFTKFPINPDHKEDFANYAKESFGEKGLTEQEGFIRMELLKPEDFPPGHKNNTFIIATYWQSKEAFMKYTQSEAFRKAHENLPPREWFAGQPTVEVYEVIKEKTK